MSEHLKLVVDNSGRNVEDAEALVARADARWVHAAWLPRRRSKPPTGRGRTTEPREPQSVAHPSQGASQAALGGDAGAVTAEYAIVILAAVAFAGLLVVIMRSSEVQAMLVDLVRNALGAAG